MGNGISTDQGNFPTHGIRDVRNAVDRKQHDWSQLAEAPITNTLLAVANSYITSRVLQQSYGNFLYGIRLFQEGCCYVYSNVRFAA